MTSSTYFAETELLVPRDRMHDYIPPLQYRVDAVVCCRAYTCCRGDINQVAPIAGGEAHKRARRMPIPRGGINVGGEEQAQLQVQAKPQSWHSRTYQQDDLDLLKQRLLEEGEEGLAPTKEEWEAFKACYAQHPVTSLKLLRDQGYTQPPEDWVLDSLYEALADWIL